MQLLFHPLSRKAIRTIIRTARAMGKRLGLSIDAANARNRPKTAANALRVSIWLTLGSDLRSTRAKSDPMTMHDKVMASESMAAFQTKNTGDKAADNARSEEKRRLKVVALLDRRTSSNVQARP